MADDGTIGVKNVTSVNSERLTAAQQENQPARRRSPRSRGVTVPEELIGPLNEHHQKLEGYIKGFVLFRDLCAESGTIRSALRDPNRWKDKWPLLEEVRRGLQEIQADFLMREIWKTDFDQQLTDFTSALEAAQTFLDSDDGPFNNPDLEQAETLTVLNGPINRMINSANSIEGQCRTKSQDEVDELGRYVKDLFDRLRRKPVGETSGLNKALSVSPLAPQEEEANPVGEFGRAGTVETNISGSLTRRDATNGQ